MARFRSPGGHNRSRGRMAWPLCNHAGYCGWRIHAVDRISRRTLPRRGRYPNFVQVPLASKYRSLSGCEFALVRCFHLENAVGFQLPLKFRRCLFRSRQARSWRAKLGRRGQSCPIQSRYRPSPLPSKLDVVPRTGGCPFLGTGRRHRSGCNGARSSHLGWVCDDRSPVLQPHSKIVCLSLNVAITAPIATSISRLPARIVSAATPSIIDRSRSA